MHGQVSFLCGSSFLSQPKGLQVSWTGHSLCVKIPVFQLMHAGIDLIDLKPNLGTEFYKVGKDIESWNLCSQMKLKLNFSGVDLLDGLQWNFIGLPPEFLSLNLSISRSVSVRKYSAPWYGMTVCHSLVSLCVLLCCIKNSLWTHFIFFLQINHKYNSRCFQMLNVLF